VGVLSRASVVVSIPRPKKEKKLPEVLSRNEVLRILDIVYNLKHESTLILEYSVCLLVGE
jgi:integrase